MSNDHKPPAVDTLQLKEPCPWLSQDDPRSAAQLNLDELISWIDVGDRTISVVGAHSFCTPSILDDLLAACDSLQPFSDHRKSTARARCNPFEKVGRAFFVARSAIKFANLDALIHFTKPLNAKGEAILGSDDLLYYADICGLPGGFIDYIQWRKGWHAKGFGLAPRRGYKFQNFGSDAVSFEIFNGANRNGDIMEPENIESFDRYVHQHVEAGVHLVIGDGTNLINRPDGIKELFSKQFHLCNCVLALSLLRVGGTFITKIFDTFTTFTVGLIYLMYKCFDEVAIVKLNSSRPANSERYLLCRRMKPQTDTVRDHLFQINRAMTSMRDTSSDVIGLVPLAVLNADKKFFDYIFDRNNDLSVKATAAIRQLLECLNDPDVIDERREELQQTCLRLWNLPATIERNTQIDMAEYCRTLVGKTPLTTKTKELLTHADVAETFENESDEWFFVPMSFRKVCTFFLSQNGSETYMYKESKWEPTANISLILPVGTLVYGELVDEYIKTGEKSVALHIIDGLVLGGTDIRHLSLQQRHAMCTKFAESINCTSTFVKDAAGTYVRKAERRCKELKSIGDIEVYVHIHRKCWRNLGRLEGKHVVHNHMKCSVGARRVYALDGLGLMRNCGDLSEHGFPLLVIWPWSPNTHFKLNNTNSQQLRKPFASDSICLATIVAAL